MLVLKAVDVVVKSVKEDFFVEQVKKSKTLPTDEALLGVLAAVSAHAPLGEEAGGEVVCKAMLRILSAGEGSRSLCMLLAQRPAATPHSSSRGR